MVLPVVRRKTGEGKAGRVLTSSLLKLCLVGEKKDPNCKRHNSNILFTCTGCTRYRRNSKW